jgi:hypothetical protein
LTSPQGFDRLLLNLRAGFTILLQEIRHRIKIRPPEVTSTTIQSFGANVEKVLPEDAIAKALRGSFPPLELSSNFSLTSRRVSELVHFHILIAPSLEQEALSTELRHLLEMVHTHQTAFNSFSTAWQTDKRRDELWKN